MCNNRKKAMLTNKFGLQWLVEFSAVWGYNWRRRYEKYEKAEK